MANANIYLDLRRDINDEVAPYNNKDEEIFETLDAGIDFVSSKVDFVKYEQHVLTQLEITQGYFDLTNEVVTLNDSYYRNEFTSYGFQFLGGKRIGIIDISGYQAGATYAFNYRARYRKFNRLMMSQAQSDLPTELERAVRLYAIAELMINHFSFDSQDTQGGIVKSKSEENLKIEYATDGSNSLSAEVRSPMALKKQALSIVMRSANAQSPFFSTQL